MYVNYETLNSIMGIRYFNSFSFTRYRVSALLRPEVFKHCPPAIIVVSRYRERIPHDCTYVRVVLVYRYTIVYR